MDLSKISIGIKTFLRDAHLMEAIAGIQETLSECTMIIADDGEHTEEKDGIYNDLQRKGNKILICPFDSGFGYKSNRIAEALETPYLLVASDDFSFREPFVRRGIEEMLAVLDNNPEISIASGRVNDRPYEFNLIDNGDEVIEVPLRQDNQPFLWFRRADLTVNYALYRKSVFSVVKWDEPEPKIGGAEHGSHFCDIKRAGMKVVWVRGVNILESKIPSSERYKQFRNRALSPERPCFDKRGIKRYVMGNGIVDYDVKEKK